MTTAFDHARDFLSATATEEFIRTGTTALSKEGLGTFFLRTTEELAAGNTASFLALADHIRTATDPYMASLAAIYGGTLVEQSAPPALLAPALVARFIQNVPLAATFLEAQASFDTHPDGFRAFAGMRFLILALMTSLSRDTAARIAARNTPDFMDSLERLRTADHQEQIQPFHYIYSLMHTFDGELDIIFPHLMRGFSIKVEAVQNSFHLFSLLQAHFHDLSEQIGLTDYPPISPDLYNFIHGDFFNEGLPTEDFARHAFSDWTAWTPTKQGNPGVQGFIPGDLSVAHIPSLNGRITILVSENPVFGSRAWNIALFPPLHDALRTRFELIRWFTYDELSHLEITIQRHLPGR